MARTLETLHVDICCVSETRIQDPTSLIHLRSPRSPAGSEFTLRVSGDPASSSRGYAGVGIALSTRAEKALLEWIPINSRLCAVRLDSSIRVNKQRNAKRHLFVVSAYAPTDCSNDETKDSFYRELSNLLRSAKQRDVVVLAGDMNAQVGRIASSEKRLGGPFGIQTNRTDNGDRLLQLCADHKLYLISTNFKHKKRQTVTWRSNNPAHPWTQIDHIAISYRWRGSAEDCRSFWNTCIDSDHALVRSRINLRLTGNKLHAKVPSKTLSEATKHTYQSGVVTHLSIPDNVSHPNDAWKCIKSAMEMAVKDITPSTSSSIHKEWISSHSAALIDARKKICSDHRYDEQRKSLKRRLTKSLRKDREQWWIAKAQEMEKAAAIGNSRVLFQLIRNTGPRKPKVSEVICEKDGTLIHSQHRRLHRWSEHFQEQFSWPESTTPFSSDNPNPEWDVDISPPHSSRDYEGAAVTQA